MNISFLGLGKLGLPCAEVIAKKGHSVRGYDIARRGNSDVLQFPTIQGAVDNVDIVEILQEEVFSTQLGAQRLSSTLWENIP